VDHVNYGSVLDPSGGAYSGATVTPNIGTLSTTAAFGYRLLNVSARVQNDLSASRERSQYRLGFSVQDFNSDGNDDFAQFTDAEDSLCAGTATNQPPQLAVTLGNSSQLYISGNSDGTLLSYNDANTVSGSAMANRIVAGGFTTLNAPRGIAVDMARNQIYVTNSGNNSILVFDDARTVTGGTAPSRVITP
jgi:DNA-binding beta-propeller fold protein YncE